MRRYYCLQSCRAALLQSCLASHLVSRNRVLPLVLSLTIVSHLLQSCPAYCNRVPPFAIVCCLLQSCRAGCNLVLPLCGVMIEGDTCVWVWTESLDATIATTRFMLPSLVTRFMLLSLAHTHATIPRTHTCYYLSQSWAQCLSQYCVSQWWAQCLS